LAAAREILVAEGPGAITLQGVAAALGMTHGSITHNFGTNLQAAVADSLVEELLFEVCTGTSLLRTGAIDEEALVDRVFEVFERTGVGRLIGWLAGHSSPLLAPLFERFARLPAELSKHETDHAAFAETDLPAIIEGIVADLLKALNLPESFTRDRVGRYLADERSSRLAATANARAE
jgi:TetR/AcrR family transcriptional regulator, repressor for neighboring sulfatase